MSIKIEGYSIDIIAAILVMFFLFWIILHFKERRRVINGIVFFISLASFIMLLIYYGMRDDIRILTIFAGAIILLFLVAAPIAFIAIVITLFSKGTELIKKEGLSISHALSFLLGLGIVFSVILSPIIVSKIKNTYVLWIWTFLITCFTYFVLGLILYTISSIIYRFYRERRNKDYLIILGSGLNKDKVTPLLQGRIDRAIKFYEEQKERNKKTPKLIMSGGQGPDELIAEAEAMKNYALSVGVPEEDILLEDKSKTTRENLRYSTAIINNVKEVKRPKVLFVTSNYHVFRAALIAKEEGYNYNGLGSWVKLYFAISAQIREYIAVLFMNKKLNIILCSIFSLMTAMNVVAQR